MANHESFSGGVPEQHSKKRMTPIAIARQAYYRYTPEVAGAQGGVSIGLSIIGSLLDNPYVVSAGVTSLLLPIIGSEAHYIEETVRLKNRGTRVGESMYVRRQRYFSRENLI